MACRTCTGHHPKPLRTFPAGNPRASLLAAHAATEARNEAAEPVHVHYDATTDTFVVVRTHPAAALAA
ncbi:hypothetical protein [Streptomyces sp. NBC_01465]|uniref:hypothetical protein n=1 Tax=Streptomyces sp. NBC_01465 TaxID=2903878 RepID=UPI002E3347F8|nr:hypothetical protein [Streptomyces sp. NBC_01465]